MTELRRARESGRRQDKFRGQKNITHRKTVDYTRGTKESPTIPRIPEMETYSCVSAGIITANIESRSEKNNKMYKYIYIGNDSSERAKESNIWNSAHRLRRLSQLPSERKPFSECHSVTSGSCRRGGSR
jgi:hypothetical protein